MFKIKLLGILFSFCWLLISASMAAEIWVEGEVGQVSSVPKPEAAPYPDCLYTMVLNIKGQEAEPFVPAEIVVVAPAFLKRKTVENTQFLRGERVKFKLVDYDDAPDSVRQLQTADDIDDFELPYFYLVQGEAIELFNPEWAAGYVPPAAAELPTPPNFPFFQPSAKAVAERQAAMRKDLAYLQNLLAESGFKSWPDWENYLAPKREFYSKNIQEKWIENTYFKTGSWVFSADFAETESFRNAVLAMNDYLKARNIDLIVLRVPGRAEICADLFNPEFKHSIVSPVYYQLQEFLLRHDVEYIDLTQRVVAERLETVAPYWYIESGEGHAAEGACKSVAGELAERLKRYDFTADLPAETTLATVSGMYNYPAGNPNFDTNTPIPVTVVRCGQKPLPIAEDGKSPVLLMGDSYFTHPTMREGGTIQHYLAWELKTVPDLLCRMSAGSGLPRFLSRKGDEYLVPRRVVIWVTKPDTVFKRIVPFAPPVYFSHKVPVASYSGEALKTLNWSDHDGREIRHFYTAEDGGELKIVPLTMNDLTTNGSGPAGQLTFDVKPYAGKFDALQVVMRLGWNWTVTTNITCGNFTDYSYLSLSDYSRKVEYLIDLSPDAETLEFDFRSVKVLRGLTLSIKRIDIYGVNK